MSDKREALQSIAAAVRQGLEEEAVALCDRALSEGLKAREIVSGGLCRGMHEAGELYERNEFFLPELLIASEAMYAGIQAVAPSLQAAGETMDGDKVVLGVIEGDVHEIGKNLVAVMLEAEGYSVIDLGYDVPPERFIEELRNSGARILALSTMMTTTLPGMRMTVSLAREMEPQASIIVGGAPLTAAVAADMGASGYCENAIGAPGLIRSLLLSQD
jgi:methanogenic corrinoid protein MtbC1